MSRLIFPNELLTKEDRVAEHNGMRDFAKCEHCGYEDNGINSVGNVYRHRYGLILCDRCTDNFDGATVWSDDHAKKRGLPLFPSGQPKRNKDVVMGGEKQ